MHWVIIGGRGMLGQDLEKLLKANNAEVTVLDRPEIDITQPNGLEALTELSKHKTVDVVVNSAAFTAVDAAEENEGIAFAVNSVGAANVAKVAQSIKAKLIYVSTDYVMPGDGNQPYAEDAFMSPVGAYGRTKAAGEWATRLYHPEAIIVRTAWIYGRYGNCFPKTMRKLAQTHPTLQVVTDEVGQPTWTVDLADILWRLVEAQAPAGVYHGTSSGQTSWHEFTQEIMRSLGRNPDSVLPTTAAAFNRPAPRPSYSALGHEAIEKVGISPIGNWKERWHVAVTDVFADQD